MIKWSILLKRKDLFIYLLFFFVNDLCKEPRVWSGCKKFFITRKNCSLLCAFLYLHKKGTEQDIYPFVFVTRFQSTRMMMMKKEKINERMSKKKTKEPFVKININCSWQYTRRKEGYLLLPHVSTSLKAKTLQTTLKVLSYLFHERERKEYTK